jgi:transposase
VKERRRILEQNMKEVPNHIMFSEMEEIHVSACSSRIRDISDSGLPRNFIRWGFNKFS